MKRIFLTIYSIIVSLLIASLAFAGSFPPEIIPGMPTMAPQEDHGVVFRYDPSRNDALDFVSRTRFAQTYAGTNRTRINSAGVLETVAANTPVIDHVGASLEPYLRLEPAAANILLGNPPTTQDLTLGVGSFTLQVFGAGTAVSSAGTATITGAGTASSGTPNTFTVTVGGTVTITISTATVVWLIPGSIPSSYFVGAAAIGAELVTNDTFDIVTDDAGELASGLLTIGNCYLISASTDGDFTAVGAPDSVVGTYFNATADGSAPQLLDAGDKVFPVTFTNWTAGTRWAPQATAGALTGKAQKVAGTASNLTQTIAGVSVGRVFRLNTVTALSAGTYRLALGGTYFTGNLAAGGTRSDYEISINAGDLQIRADSSFAGTIDSVSVKEHGTVRLSEANTVTLAVPAAVTAMLAASGTIVIKGRFAFARAAGVVTNVLASAAATNSLIYTTTAAGNITSNDGTTIAENTGAYTANTDQKIALKFPSDTDKYRIGIDVAGAGIVWGTEVAFDGAFTATANLILGYVLHGTTWIKYIKIYDKVLTDAQINAMR